MKRRCEDAASWRGVKSAALRTHTRSVRGSCSVRESSRNRRIAKHGPGGRGVGMRGEAGVGKYQRIDDGVASESRQTQSP